VTADTDFGVTGILFDLYFGWVPDEIACSTGSAFKTPAETPLNFFSHCHFLRVSTLNQSAQIDPRTLLWIKQEVAESLTAICKALELFGEQNDASQLPACADGLDKIRGALEMLEISGGVSLAREMHQVALGLVADTIELKKDAVEVLMRGIIQLPAYLEHLYHGNPDVPLILLPILNDLRAVQNKQLLTEGAFFFTDLAVRKPSLIDRSGEAATWDLPTMAKKLRPAYLAAMLGVFREVDLTKNFKLLATVILNLEQSAASEKSEQLWWVSAGVVHALHDKGLELSVAVKLLLGRIDRQVKRVIDSGEVALQRDPPDELVKNLLYYVARSTSRSSRVVELKTAFKLEQAMPESGALSDARDQLIGFNANLMANVSEQIKEEMLRIKDELDIAIHANKGDPTLLAPVNERLRTVADTLDMLGLQSLANLARGQHEFLQASVERRVVLKDNDVMHVAGALLYIESSLCDLSLQASTEFLRGNGAVAGAQLPEAEFRQLVKLVASEALMDLAKVKDAFTRYIFDPSQLIALQNVPEMLNVVRGVLAILTHERPARVAGRTQQYLVEEIIDKKIAPTEKALELIANAVGAVEYFLESLLEKAVAPEPGLDLAERSLAELGYPVRRSGKDAAAAMFESPLASNKLLLSAKPVVSLVNRSAPTEPEITADVHVDEELLAVFSIEADDELAAIYSNLQQWRANREDTESLSTLIRSFHTLKGAGRIIGATSVGVLAWSVEELLRRVQDGRVPSNNNKVIDLLEQTLGAFSVIVAQIKLGNLNSGPPVQALIDMARDLRQPAQMASN
jgi:chemosensory pili system protein ChpA (sensor histidine kinase/response regulator)